MSKVPLGDLFRNQPKQVLFGAGCMVGVFTFSFMGGTYLTGYASRVLEHPRWLVLLAGALGAVAMLIMTAISAAMCDKRGRRPIILLGFALAVPWSFVVMPLLNTGSPAALILGIMGTFGILGITYGPMASFIPEQFHTPVPLHRRRPGVQPRRHPRRCRATAGRDRPADRVRQLGDRRDAGSPGGREPGEHLRLEGDPRGEHPGLISSGGDPRLREPSAVLGLASRGIVALT